MAGRHGDIRAGGEMAASKKIKANKSRRNQSIMAASIKRQRSEKEMA